MARSFLPVYFYPGPEVGRKRDRLDELKEALEKQDGEAPELHRFYPYDSETPEIISLLKNGSLFSSRRLVILADAHALKAADIKIFKEYIAKPSPEAILVFTTDEGPGSRAYPRSLADALPKKAVEVFWEMFERDKRGWVMKFFREKGLRADSSGVDLLIDVTEGTTDALKEACELLAFSVDTGQIIGEADIDRVLEHGRDETVYSLFDRFCRRDLSGVLESYRKMLHSDPGSVDRILSMLADPLTRLGEFAVLLSRGLPAGEAAKELKLRGGKRAIKAYTDGAQRFSLDELGSALRQLINLESWLRNAPRELRAPKTEIWFCHIIGRS
ncbi:MAG: DNA polymerase III subunit delta [Spirochaetaceae bacterium]|nr:DNA polymerase III subunit delta [Spirochaetaceae bacterium]